MKIYNKKLLLLGFALIAVPSFFPLYYNYYTEFIQAIGLVFMILAFKKPKSNK